MRRNIAAASGLIEVAKAPVMSELNDARYASEFCSGALSVLKRSTRSSCVATCAARLSIADRVAVHRGNTVQTADQVIQRIGLLHKRIVVAQDAGPRAQDIALQVGFQPRKTVRLIKREIEAFRVGIDGAYR